VIWPLSVLCFCVPALAQTGSLRGQPDHFTVTFDGKKAIEWDDDIFKEAGKVGVWTKADSVTLFDDFSYRTNTPEYFRGGPHEVGHQRESQS
jgi:hypothetical protein